MLCYCLVFYYFFFVALDLECQLHERGHALLVPVLGGCAVGMLHEERTMRMSENKHRWLRHVVGVVFVVFGLVLWGHHVQIAGGASALSGAVEVEVVSAGIAGSPFRWLSWCGILLLLALGARRPQAPN